MKLRDFVVEEISLVDKPANKRKFILLKSLGKEDKMDRLTELLEQFDLLSKEIEEQFNKRFPAFEILDQFRAKLEDEGVKLSDEAKALLDRLEKFLQGYLEGKYPYPRPRYPYARYPYIIYPYAKYPYARKEEKEEEKDRNKEDNGKETGTEHSDKGLEELEKALASLEKAIENVVTKEDLKKLLKSGGV